MTRKLLLKDIHLEVEVDSLDGNGDRLMLMVTFWKYRGP